MRSYYYLRFIVACLVLFSLAGLVQADQSFKVVKQVESLKLANDSQNQAPFCNSIYIAGGVWNVFAQDVWAFDQNYNWNLVNSVAPFGTSFGHGAEYFQDKLWIFGGEWNKKVWSLNGTAWTQHPDAPWGDDRALFAHAKYNNKIWVLGGSNSYAVSNSEVWSFDGTTWVQHPDAPWGPRYLHKAVVYQNKIWVMGGVNYTGAANFYNNEVWSYDGITWTQHANAPWTPRADHLSTVFQNKIWILNGTNDSGIHKDIWSFDGTTWTQHPDGPWGDSYVSGSALVFDNKLFTIALKSISPNVHNEVWVFDGSTWTPDPNPPFSSRVYFSATPIICSENPSGDRITISADNRYDLYVNGQLIGSGSNWRQSQTYPVQFVDGKNVVAVKSNSTQREQGGLLVEVIENGNRAGTSGKTWKSFLKITDRSWTTLNYDDSYWDYGTDLGPYAIQPWGFDVLDMPLDTPGRWIWNHDDTSNSGRDVYFRYLFDR